MPHGLTLTESTSGARTVKLPSLAVIGLVATAGAAVGAPTTALNAAFPLDTPVLVTSVANAIAKAGTTGTLKPALEAFDDITSPLVVVIRVAEGVDADATEENVIAGIQALLTAESVVGKRPRILGAPGLETADVKAELVIAAKKLRAMSYARAAGDTIRGRHHRSRPLFRARTHADLAQHVVRLRRRCRGPRAGPARADR